MLIHMKLKYDKMTNQPKMGTIQSELHNTIRTREGHLMIWPNLLGSSEWGQVHIWTRTLRAYDLSV